MRKICLNCLCIFHSEIALEYCPIVHCVRSDLVEIDDQMVDVIRGLWARDIGTRNCCSGHVYERFFDAYLVFDGFYNEFIDMDLSGFRELLIAVNGESGRVAIEEIEERNGEEILIVKSSCDSGEKDPKQKLKCQVDFVEFFYDVLARIDALEEEIVKRDEVSVMETDIAET